jgi:acetyltransferase-like isoleucine patch superfamily enzyme
MAITALPWRAKAWIERARHRSRRTAFIVRLRTHAFWQRATVDIDLATDIKIARGVRVTLAPRTTNVIRVGPHCAIAERVLIMLDGGHVELADWVELRRDVILTVAGRLTFEGRNLLQPGVSIHCDEAVTLRRLVMVGDRTTIVDSTHYFTEPDDPFVDNLKTGPVELGYNTWVGAKATIGRNVTVGHHSIVAANSLLLIDVPDGHLASGVPATVVRRVYGSTTDGETVSDQLTD